MAVDPDWVQHARELARRGEKIQSIKLIRERTGMGLLQAKQLMELLPTGAAVDPSALVADAEYRRQGRRVTPLALVALAAVIAYVLARWLGAG